IGESGLRSEPSADVSPFTSTSESAVPPESGASLVETFVQRAAAHPERTAFRFLGDGEAEAESVTWGELDRRARALADHLRVLGAPGARALLLHPPGLEFVTAFLGC